MLLWTILWCKLITQPAPQSLQNTQSHKMVNFFKLVAFLYFSIKMFSWAPWKGSFPCAVVFHLRERTILTTRLHLSQTWTDDALQPQVLPQLSFKTRQIESPSYYDRYISLAFGHLNARCLVKPTWLWFVSCPSPRQLSPTEVTI